MKRTPLKRKTALRAKRAPDRPEKPVRARQAPKLGHIPIARRMSFYGDAVGLGCIACGLNLVTIHHVTASIHGGRLARRDDRVVPLCPRHHQIQHGPRESVEALGHGGFYRKHGIDLLREAERIWSEWDKENPADL